MDQLRYPVRFSDRGAYVWRIDYLKGQLCSSRLAFSVLSGDQQRKSLLIFPTRCTSSNLWIPSPLRTTSCGRIRSWMRLGLSWLLKTPCGLPPGISHVAHVCFVSSLLYNSRVSVFVTFHSCLVF